MILYTLVPLVSMIICLGIAASVYYSDRRNRINILFALFNLLVVYWIFTAEFMYNQYLQAGNIREAENWSHIGFLKMFAIPLFVHFILAFTEKKRLLENRLIYLVLYAPAAFFSIIDLLTDLLTISKDNVFIERDWPANLAFPAYLVWSFLATLGLLVVLVRFSMKNKDEKKKNQTKLIFLGLFLGLLMGALSVILLVLKIEFPKPGALIMTSCNVCIGYAIRTYDLFRIDPVKAMEYIVDTMPDSLILLHANGMIVEANNSLLRLTGYRTDEIVEKHVAMLFRDEAIGRKLLDELWHVGEIIDRETQFRSRSGRTIDILLSCSVMKTKTGQRIGIVAIATDITKMKSAEKQLIDFNKRLVQSNRELEDFAYIASHDLREPLRKIRTFGDRLKSEYRESLDERGRDYLDRMQNAATRMSSLIEGLLNYSRIATTGNDFRETDLGRTVNDVLADLEVKIEETACAVDVGALPRVNADATQMRQLFQNLIGNALKFHKPDTPPRIRIYDATGSDKCFHSLVVEDNGIGIARKDFDAIFTMFHRLHGKHEFEGSGIGLSVCKKIVERHGGTISVESEIGTGTRFVIRLPV